MSVKYFMKVPDTLRIPKDQFIIRIIFDFRTDMSDCEDFFNRYLFFFEIFS